MMSLLLWRKFVRPIYLLAVLLPLVACATANTGGVKRSVEVAQAIENYNVNPDYHYYLYNQETNPYALVGLHKEYFVEDPDWRPLDPGSAAFGKVIDLVKSFPTYYNSAYGSYIMNSQGDQIGVWYSSLPAPGISVDPETKRVSINAPRPWLDDNDYWRSSMP